LEALEKFHSSFGSMAVNNGLFEIDTRNFDWRSISVHLAMHMDL